MKYIPNGSIVHFPKFGKELYLVIKQPQKVSYRYLGRWGYSPSCDLDHTVPSNLYLIEELNSNQLYTVHTDERALVVIRYSNCKYRKKA
jgi:hypothetical protein